MAIFNTATLKRFYEQGEDHVSHDRPFLVDRVSLPLVAGQSKYTLPNSITSVRRITYMGMKLDPIPARNLRDVFQGATQQGQPFWYVYSNVGVNQIQLFPVPATSLLAADAASDLWSTAIPTSFIIEFYRLTDNNLFVIPPYLKPQLLKTYVAKQCSAIEGPGNSLKMRDYFKQSWDKKEAEFGSWVDEVMNKPRKLVISETFASNFFPGKPQLPLAMIGTGVDAGE